MRKTALSAIIHFSTWNLRRRAGQMFPVMLAFLLLVFTTQTIGTLHDISSLATQQKIAQNWRGPYDLFIRPQAAVSQLERDTKWIDPQSILETYGGINDQQIAAIRSLPHIVSITPIANLGWQAIDVHIPVTLPSKGIYRISATWTGQGITAPAITSYIDVSDLHTLTTESPSPIVTHLIANNDKPIIFPTSLPAVQALIGTPTSAQTTLTHILIEGILSTSAVHFSLHLDKLSGHLSMLATCLNKTACWTAQPLHQGTISYQPQGVQLVRYSRTNYAATSQELTDGQLVVTSSGADIQGPLYRTQLPSYISVPANLPTYPQTAPLHVLPFSAPQHLPLIANALRFIPLAQACNINGANCYSGLYVRLSGVENYSQSSVALLQATSAAITTRTGLHVDILDGSSPRMITLTTSPQQLRQPVQSSWRVVGVAVQIVHGLDAIQTLLLILCSTVCLLAIGASGVLVGIGHRKEVVLLQQLGWQRSPILFFLALDVLLLCLPACLLAVTELILTLTLWPNSLPLWLIWSLLSSGIFIYCSTLVSIAYSKQGRHQHQTHIRRHITHHKVTIPCVLFLALFASIFLIAIEYLLFTNFDHVLVVTVLGSQVRAALEVPQLVLVLLILTSACLTIGLCATLILRGRRDEISLLAQLGWQRRDVLLRLLRDYWSVAFLGGEMSVIFALGIVCLGETLPSLVNIVSLLLCGPLVSFLLLNTAMLGPSWQETKRVYPWK